MQSYVTKIQQISQNVEKSPSVHIRIHYYHFTQEKLWKKYENIINKVEQREELSDMEALDIAFIPKFISKEDAPFITESLAKIFKEVIISDKELKRDVIVLLGAMILKNIENEIKQDELLEDIGMTQIEEEIKILAREEYGEELSKIEKEKNKLQQEYNEMKKGIEKLSKRDDLNPEVKKIINSLM